MSGIVGIFNLDREPVSRPLLKRLTQSLEFRGPDGLSMWVNDSVGFGCTLLKIPNEPSEQQPLSLDGQVWLIADARIDGRRELTIKLAEHFGELKSRLHTERLPDDDELILLAYQMWGEDCLKHLIGDFSFAIWDGHKRQLFCARDQMGVGQFYYCLTRRTFVFSNTLDCLRLHPAVSSNLNEVAIGDFLLFGLNQDRDTTIFQDIRRLPRAHSLLLHSARAVKTNEYWKPTTGNVRYKSKFEYVERFNELLDSAVADRLRPTNIGVAMSGGLDSSMIAARAQASFERSSSPSSLKAYCVVYDRVFRDDERYFASEVARALTIPIEFLEGDRINATSSPRTSGYAPEPFDVEPFYVVSDELLKRLASTSRVALTGWDGDTFMTETPKYLFYEFWRSRDLGQLSKEMLRYVYFRRRPPPVGLRTWWSRRRAQHDKPIYPRWINQEFTKKLSLEDRWQQKTSGISSYHPTRPYAFRNLNTPSWDTLFAGFDAGISRLPLNVRHPLIDVRLVSYLLSVPIIPWLLEKYILREAMQGVLPDSIRKRKKTPLSGDPGLQLRYSTKAKDIDTFVPTPDVLHYIRRDAVPLVTTETDRNALWVNARPFSLNQWLIHSYKRGSKSSLELPDEELEYSQTNAVGST